MSVAINNNNSLIGNEIYVKDYTCAVSFGISSVNYTACYTFVMVLNMLHKNDQSLRTNGKFIN